MFEINPQKVEREFLQDIGNQGLENASLEIVSRLCTYIRQLQSEVIDLKRIIGKK